MQCWHQYNSTNTIVDFVWKLEICQYNIIENALTAFSPTSLNALNQSQSNKSFFIGEQLSIEQKINQSPLEMLSVSTSVLCK